MRKNETETPKIEKEQAPLTRWQQIQAGLAFIVKFPWPAFCIFLGAGWFNEYKDHRTDNSLNAVTIKAQTDFMNQHLLDDSKESKERGEKYELYFHNINSHAVDTIYLRDNGNTGTGRP